MSRIYHVNIGVSNEEGYTRYFNYIYAYSLEEAIDKGKKELYNYYIDSNSKISFDDFMKKLDYYFFINVISGNRLRFNTYKEINDYFTNKISKISNDKLYDFLLSLIDHMYYAYDYTGKLLEYMGDLPMVENKVIIYDIAFTEEGCLNNEYQFKILD